MEEIYTKKNIYHKNNPYNELKKNGIIYPNLRTKFKSPDKDEFLKYLNKREFSNKYIYSKAKKKLNKKSNNNHNIYKINARKINLSLPKNMNASSKYLNIKGNAFTQTQNINKNFKNNINYETYNSATYMIDKKMENNLSENKIIICQENNIFIENKNIKDKEKEKKSIESVYKLWDCLYVPYSYRELFNVILRQLDEEERNKIIENEFNELNELKNEIDNLLYAIKMRKNILNELKDMNNKLRLIFKTESEESNFVLVKHMSNKIEKMRNYTINICFYMKNLKNQIYNGIRIGKYDIDIISNQFKFDKNYLIKMKEEMNFLKDGYAKYFFNIMEDQTPFLLKASEEDPNANGDPFIHLVPISKEIKAKIDKCNFIIYQELIAYQNKDFKDKKFRPISPLINYNNFDYQNISLNSSTFNRYSSNSLLKPINGSGKKALFENDFINKYPKLKVNNQSDLHLRENSCINFEIKNKNENNILIQKENKNRNNLMPNIIYKKEN